MGKFFGNIPEIKPKHNFYYHKAKNRIQNQTERPYYLLDSNVNIEYRKRVGNGFSGNVQKMDPDQAKLANDLLSIGSMTNSEVFSVGASHFKMLGRFD